jgi:hypothetical protein
MARNDGAAGVGGHPHGSGLGEIRYVVERSFAWLHRHRRLATYERHPDIHDALFGIGCILICWRHLERSVETNTWFSMMAEGGGRPAMRKTPPEARSCVTVRSGLLRVPAQIGQRRTR